MKFVFFSDFTPIPTVDSGLNIDGRLAQALIERGDEVCWITSDFDHYKKKKRKISDFFDKSFTLKIVKSLGYSNNISISRMLHNVLFSLKCIRFAKLFLKSDFVISPIPAIETSFVASILCLLRRKKHIILVYDKWPDIFLHYKTENLILKYLSKFLFYFYKFLFVFSLRRANLVVAVSNEYAVWLRNVYGVNNVRVLYIGCDDINVVESKFFEKITVLYMGSWGRSYDIETIVQTAALMISNKDVHFVIAGRTDHDQNYTCTNNLTVCGWVEGLERQKLMDAADIGVMSYKKDAIQSLPNKIFEYGVHGVYIINTLPNESKDLIIDRNIGITIPSESPEILMQTILNYMSSDEKNNKHLRSERIKSQYGKSMFDRFVNENFNEKNNT